MSTLIHQISHCSLWSHKTLCTNLFHKRLNCDSGVLCQNQMFFNRKSADIEQRARGLTITEFAITSPYQCPHFWELQTAFMRTNNSLNIFFQTFNKGFKGDIITIPSLLFIVPGKKYNTFECVQQNADFYIFHTRMHLEICGGISHWWW